MSRGAKLGMFYHSIWFKKGHQCHVGTTALNKYRDFFHGKQAISSNVGRFWGYPVGHILMTREFKDRFPVPTSGERQRPAMATAGGLWKVGPTDPSLMNF